MNSEENKVVPIEGTNLKSVVTENQNIASVEQVKLVNQVNNQQAVVNNGVSTVQPVVGVTNNAVSPVVPEQPITVNNNINSVAPEQLVVNQQSVDLPPLNNNGNNFNNNNDDNNVGPSSFAKIMTVILFVFLFAFIYFLGDITDYINERKMQKLSAEILSGRLICTNKQEEKDLAVKYVSTFTFKNKELIDSNFITTYTGDKNRDKKDLELIKNNCKNLASQVNGYNGIKVICSLNNGIASKKQLFIYKDIEMRKVSSAFSEAGGIYPQFKYKQKIDTVEGKMISSGYTCEKVSD